MKEKFNASDAAARLRFHTQTGGATLTAQQPLNNVVRVAIQAMAAVLGGTQSLHTNSYDEALALPTERSATLALRTQQLLAHETGVPDVVDPLGGSWYVEGLTDRIEAAARGVGGGSGGWWRFCESDRARVFPGSDRAQRVRAAAGHRGGQAGRRGSERIRHQRADPADSRARLHEACRSTAEARGRTPGTRDGGTGEGLDRSAHATAVETSSTRGVARC